MSSECLIVYLMEFSALASSALSLDEGSLILSRYVVDSIYLFYRKKVNFNNLHNIM